MNGEVPKTDVLYVLKANGVEVRVESHNGAEMYILTKGSIVEAHQLDSHVGRRVLHGLQRKFEIPIHQFYNPLEAPTTPDEKVQ